MLTRFLRSPAFGEFYAYRPFRWALAKFLLAMMLGLIFAAIVGLSDVVIHWSAGTLACHAGEPIGGGGFIGKVLTGRACD